MHYEKVEEDVLFIAWGKQAVKNEKSYLVNEGETVEGIIDQIKDSTKNYRKIYTLRVKGVDKPIIVTGKTDLNNKLGYGNMAIKPVQVNDGVRITFVGKYKTKIGEGYKFEVAVARKSG
ncbi:MAG: hypothetical protein R6U65_07295 [Perlabentimonas sp.]